MENNQNKLEETVRNIINEILQNNEEILKNAEEILKLHKKLRKFTTVIVGLFGFSLGINLGILGYILFL